MPSRLPTIRTKLAILVLACAVPSVLFSGLFVYSEHRQFRQHVTQSASASARSVAAALDKDFRSIESALQTLSVSPTLNDEQMGAFYETAIKALPFQNVSNFVVIDNQGRQRLNTLKQYGTPLPRSNSAPEEILAIPEIKQTVVSNVFLGPVTGKPILAMGVPVVRNGQVPYSLNVGIFPERIYRLLKEQDLPANWLTVILDGKGQVVARTHDMERFVGKPGASALLEKLKSARNGVMEVTTLEGIDVISAFEHTQYSNWSVAVGVPKSELFSELSNKVIQFIALSIALTLTLLTFAWLFAVSQIIRPMERLLQRMRALAQGDDLGPQLTHSNREFRSLEIGLEEMADQLQTQESEKKELLKQLVTTLESITDGFILLDMNWRYQYINRRAETLLGIDRSTLLNQDWRHMPPISELRSAHPMIERVMKNQTPINKLVVETNAPQITSIELKMFHTATGVALYLVDITQRKQMVQAQAAKEAAEAANQAKNSFLARTSHELRTPLNAIVGLTQVLLNDRQQPLQSQHLRSIKLIESSSMHLMALINDILDISRAEAGTLHLQIESVAVDRIVEEALGMVRTEAQAAGLSLKGPKALEGQHVQADAIRLRQVLINLLTNAIKYNKVQGEVTLECTAEDESIRFCIKDTGIGITPDQIRHLFEPFNRLGMEKTTIPGTGMGLVIAKYLIERMAGQLSVVSTPGVGSTFTFLIPRCTPAIASTTAELSAPPRNYSSMIIMADNIEACHEWAGVLAHRPQLNVSFVQNMAELENELSQNHDACIALSASSAQQCVQRQQIEQIMSRLKLSAKVVQLPEPATHGSTEARLRWLDEALSEATRL